MQETLREVASFWRENVVGKYIQTKYVQTTRFLSGNVLVKEESYHTCMLEDLSFFERDRLGLTPFNKNKRFYFSSEESKM